MYHQNKRKNTSCLRVNYIRYGRPTFHPIPYTLPNLTSIGSTSPASHSLRENGDIQPFNFNSDKSLLGSGCPPNNYTPSLNQASSYIYIRPIKALPRRTLLSNILEQRSSHDTINQRFRMDWSSFRPNSDLDLPPIILGTDTTPPRRDTRTSNPSSSYLRSASKFGVQQQVIPPHQSSSQDWNSGRNPADPIDENNATWYRRGTITSEDATRPHLPPQPKSTSQKSQKSNQTSMLMRTSQYFAASENVNGNRCTKLRLREPDEEGRSGSLDFSDGWTMDQGVVLQEEMVQSGSTDALKRKSSSSYSDDDNQLIGDAEGSFQRDDAPVDLTKRRRIE
ncbi:hypothetical protein PSTT_01540 [Puccinia striiformis]|uniref:Uncharacterized protein n=1 Tax=Puccinia striiformis TaxID=27350 RepID=A0A2S4W324_9BASI|nr:hypothetical protein PSTT_01540 [Puccinia striiformis]